MSTIIRPHDFRFPFSDPQHDVWTGSAFATVVSVLKETTVHIVTDTETGHTVMDARLGPVAARGTGSLHNTGHVLIQAPSLPKKGLWHPLDTCGIVLPVEAHDAKWDAMVLFLEQRSEAIRCVREHEEHGSHASGRMWGRWTAVPLSAPGTFVVRYEPNTRDKTLSKMWGEPFSGHVALDSDGRGQVTDVYRTRRAAPGRTSAERSARRALAEG
ncbi:hypothetical protein [Streptomyces sp. TR02-1]|uniref:hypothetical protein n=1 Tax=Streptomyces sp. TR02-1 TaxID=3385977 RepID=UPI0039A244E5